MVLSLPNQFKKKKEGNMPIKKTVFFISLLSLFIFPGFSEDEKYFDEAQSHFQKALEGSSSYLRAAMFFSQSLAHSQHPRGEVYYNLGNALYLAQEPVSALLAYEIALKLKPWNQDIRDNRRIVRKELGIETTNNLMSDIVSGTFISTSLGRIILFFLLLLALGLALTFLFKSKPLYRRGGIICLALALVVQLFLLWPGKGIERLAVVKSDNTVLRLGDNPLYEALVSLPPGKDVYIIENRTGWSRVKLQDSSGNNLQGWVMDSEIMRAPELVERYR